MCKFTHSPSHTFLYTILSSKSLYSTLFSQKHHSRKVSINFEVDKRFHIQMVFAQGNANKYQNEIGSFNNLTAKITSPPTITELANARTINPLLDQLPATTIFTFNTTKQEHSHKASLFSKLAKQTNHSMLILV